MQSETEYHNRRYADKEKIPLRYSIGLAAWYEAYFRYLEQARGALLELGGGLESPFLSRPSLVRKLQNGELKCTSIDISPVAISNASKEVVDNLCFRVDDAHFLHTVPPNSIDVFVGQGIVHHLDISTMLKALDSRSKSRLKFIFAEPIRGNLFLRLFRLLTPNQRTPDEKPLSTRDLQLLTSSTSLPSTIEYYGFLSVILSLFRIKWGLAYICDRVILNSLRLGPLLAWAVIIHTEL